MNLISLPVFITLITALLWLPPSAAAEGLAGHHYKVQFKQWYKQYGFIFAKLLAQNCSLEYEAYLYNTRENSTIDWDGGGDEHNTLTQPVVGCLLEVTPQFVMSSTQSAQVLLGLTPTILAILGASTDESATLAVVGTRPLLSFLLACGSPSVYLSPAFDFKDPVKILSKHRPQRYCQDNKRHRPVFFALLLVLQYALALAATANIAMLDYELGVQAICGFASEWMLMPLLWSSSVLAIYVLGVVWHRLRVQREIKPLKQDPDSNDCRDSSSSSGHAASWVQIIKRRVQGEFRLSLKNGKVKVVAAAEGKTHIVLGWVLSVISILHIIFGTLTLSSLLFIGPRDALKLIARFVASGLVCRIITMYELAGLRENFVPVDEGSLSVSQDLVVKKNEVMERESKIC